MNDLVLINEWIGNKDRDFGQGLFLYRKFKPNSSLDEYFSKQELNPDASAKSILFQKMLMIRTKIQSNPKFLEETIARNILEQKPIGSNPTPPRKPEPVTVKPKAEIKVEKVGPVKVPATAPVVIDYTITATVPIDAKAASKLDNLPPHLSSAGLRIRELTPLISGLQAKLKALAPDQQAEAQTLLEKIFALDTEKRTLWGHIDKHFGVKDFEEEVSPAPANLEQLKKKIKLCKDSINRIKGKLPEQRKGKPALAKKSEEALKQKLNELKDLEAQLVNIN